MAQESKGQLCSVCITQKIIRGKWKIVIIWLLKDGKKRFSELERMIPNITQSYLTSQLRELEKSGLVVRKMFNVIPPKVEYSLSNKGKEFLEVVDAMEKWGQGYIREVLTT
ncbi:helix-turn-helix transcriptional regulator [Clostridia bacterium]|nr:helix-turn-helix transcriptional regulator [Clostridia bacterium]